MITFTMNDREITVEEGTSLLEAARMNDIEIPTLCYDETLSVFGGCRLCIVEVGDKGKLVTSCSERAREGMVVQTESEKVVETRKNILDLLLSNHPVDCLTCDKAGTCDLQDYAYQYGVREGSFKGEVKNYAIDDINPVMERDQSKCILCGKCVRVCDELQVTNAIDFVDRGFDSMVTTAHDKPLDYDNCRLCGQCISVCPTGALLNKQLKGTRPWKVKKVTTTCPFCGTGCNFDLNVVDGKVVGVTPHDDAPVNGSQLCVKGRFHIDMINSPDRLKKPLIKKDGEFVESSWDEAMDLVASKISHIRDTYGPDAMAGLSSARCTNEDNYVFQKFFRSAIGTNNVDHCART